MGCEVNHSPPSSAKVKNERCYTSSPPIYLHGVDRENFTVLLFLISDHKYEAPHQDM